RVEHLPTRTMDRARVAGALVSLLGGCRAAEGSHRARDWWCARPHPRLRFPICPHFRRESRRRPQSQFITLATPDVPPAQALFVAKEIGRASCRERVEIAEGRGSG